MCRSCRCTWFTWPHLQSQRCHSVFVITLTHLPVVMVVTQSARFGNIACYLRTRLRVFLHRVPCDSHTQICISCDFTFSSFSREITLLFRRSNGKPNIVSLPCRVLAEVSKTTRGNLFWSCLFTNMLGASCYSVLMNLSWLKFHFLVNLLLIYSATKVLTVLYDASSGTIACGTCRMWHHCHTYKFGA